MVSNAEYPAGYRKTPPYSKSRFVRTYVPASSTFALVLVADELLRENVVDDARSKNGDLAFFAGDLAFLRKRLSCCVFGILLLNWVSRGSREQRSVLTAPEYDTYVLRAQARGFAPRGEAEG